MIVVDPEKSTPAQHDAQIAALVTERDKLVAALRTVVKLLETFFPTNQEAMEPYHALLRPYPEK